MCYCNLPFFVRSRAPWKYSCPLNNVCLNFRAPLLHAYFSIVNTTVLHDPWLVEFKDVGKPLIWKADYKLYAD